MSINVASETTVADKVMEFMTAYVQTHKIPYQELPDLIAKLITTYTSPGISSEVANENIGKTVSVMPEASSDISGNSLLSQPVSPAALEPTVKRGRGRPPKAYTPSPNLVNISATPKVAIENSVFPDHLICLIDGKKVVMLKRYLRTHFGITFEDYKRLFNLPQDYPACSPNHSEAKRQKANEIGLGLQKAA